MTSYTIYTILFKYLHSACRLQLGRDGGSYCLEATLLSRAVPGWSQERLCMWRCSSCSNILLLFLIGRLAQGQQGHQQVWPREGHIKVTSRHISPDYMHTRPSSSSSSWPWLCFFTMFSPRHELVVPFALELQWTQQHSPTVVFAIADFHFLLLI